MSNYLANLATRSAGQEMPLQPRPVSLFEPWPGVGMGALPVLISPVVGEEGEAWETAVAATPPTPAPVPPTVNAPQMVWQTAVPPHYTPPEPPMPTLHPERPPASITTTIHAAAQQQPIQPAALPPAAPPLPPAVHPQAAAGNGRSPASSPPSPITITSTQVVPQPPTNPGQPPSIHNSQFTIPSSAARTRAHHSSDHRPHRSAGHAAATNSTREKAIAVAGHEPG